MRVSNTMMSTQLKRNLNNNLITLKTYQNQIATGRKINKPSDDPSGTSVAMHLRTTMAEEKQFVRNIDNAISYLETTESAINNINNVLQRVRELTVKAANQTQTPNDLQIIAVEVKELKAQLQNVANTTYNNQHVFGGTNVTQRPCQEDGSWVGNDSSIEVAIASGITMAINLNNKDMNYFFAADPSDSSSQGIFAVMDQIISDLETANYSALGKEDLAALDAKINDLFYSEALIGAKINRMELQQNRLKNNEVTHTELLSNQEDISISEAAVQFKTAETVYNAALSVGAHIVQKSIVDFLR